MNLQTFDFQLTAIDRALLGLLEERARLLKEASTAITREPDMNDLESQTSGCYQHADLATLFTAIHTAGMRSMTAPGIFGLGPGGAR